MKSLADPYSTTVYSHSWMWDIAASSSVKIHHELHAKSVCKGNTFSAIVLRLAWKRATLMTRVYLTLYNFHQGHGYHKV